jgi:hypothetical protein
MSVGDLTKVAPVVIQEEPALGEMMLETPMDGLVQEVPVQGTTAQETLKEGLKYEVPVQEMMM